MTLSPITTARAKPVLYRPLAVQFREGMAVDQPPGHQPPHFFDTGSIPQNDTGDNERLTEPPWAGKTRLWRTRIRLMAYNSAAKTHGKDPHIDF
jgi:hypothetical protein